MASEQLFSLHHKKAGPWLTLLLLSLTAILLVPDSSSCLGFTQYQATSRWWMEELESQEKTKRTQNPKISGALFQNTASGPKD
jgi:hypothetical protein